MKHARLLVDDVLPTPSAAGLASWYTPGLSDALGDRLLMFDTTASSLELLRFKPELTSTPGFEAALRARVEELAGFSHPSIAVVRKVEWLGDSEDLALVSNQVEGRRLSEVMGKARGPAFALELVRQVVPALASLEQRGEHISHGVITPERIVVTPEGRLVLTEHVIGPALESLRLSASALRSLLGIAVPPASGAASLDGRSDLIQVSFLALSMLLGRRLSPAEYPSAIGKLLDELVETNGRNRGPARRLRFWLERALQVADAPFESARHAEAALRHLPEESELLMPAPLRALESHPPAAAPERVPSLALASLSPLNPPDADNAPAAASVESEEATPVIVPRKSVWRRWALPAVSAIAIIEAAAVVALLVTRPRQITAAAGGQPSAASAASTVPSPAPAPAAAVPAAPSRSLGRLEISSDVPGARVTVDGTPRGQTPLTLELDPGVHSVLVVDRERTVTQTVAITAGGSSTLVAAMGSAGMAAGWLSVSSPIELQILEGGALVGTTSAARVLLPAGLHNLVLTNSAFGFQTTLSADIKIGRATALNVSIPNGSLSLNAIPWANVWVDGRALGSTPIANLDLSIGNHEVIWRHPQLGERRQTAAVTAKGPVRLVMDLNK